MNVLRDLAAVCSVNGMREKKHQTSLLKHKSVDKKTASVWRVNFITLGLWLDVIE